MLHPGIKSLPSLLVGGINPLLLLDVGLSSARWNATLLVGPYCWIAGIALDLISPLIDSVVPLIAGSLNPKGQTGRSAGECPRERLKQFAKMPGRRMRILADPCGRDGSARWLQVDGSLASMGTRLRIAPSASEVETYDRSHQSGECSLEFVGNVLVPQKDQTTGNKRRGKQEGKKSQKLKGGSFNAALAETDATPAAERRGNGARFPKSGPSLKPTGNSNPAVATGALLRAVPADT